MIRINKLNTHIYKLLSDSRNANERSLTSIILLSILLIAIQVIAPEKVHAFKFSAKVCRKYNLGSNWYCEPNKNDNSSNQANPLTSHDEIMTRDIPPEQKAVLLNQLWEVQQKRAVITGDKKDLENVLVTQRYIAGLGGEFAKKMLRLTETVPAYSKSDSYYQQVSDEFIIAAEQEQVLKNAKDRYAVAFIYASSCPYCKRQLPILHSLKEDFGMTILGVSADGGVYPGLDEVITDRSVTNDPNIQSFPTMMLVDSKTGKRLFIAKGLTTKDQLETLIYKKIIEVENG